MNFLYRSVFIVVSFVIGLCLIAAPFALDAFFRGLYHWDNTFAIMESRVRECLVEGQFDEALKNADLLVQRAVDRPFGARDAYHLRAVVHSHRNDTESAIRDLRSAIADLPTPRCSIMVSKWTVAMGRCYECAGMPEAAAKEYREAYEALVDRYASDNKSRPTDRHNYMSVIDDFWTARHDTDEEFGFKQLEVERNGSNRETKRARREAVLNWMRGFIDVHSEITANIDNVDAKVFSLGEDRPVELPLSVSD